MLELTSAQLAIWFEQRLHPDQENTGFFSVSLIGELDERMVAQACAGVVARHPALRSLIQVEGERVFGVELPAGTAISFSVLDLDCPSGEELAAATAWQVGQGSGTWDLTRELPVNFVLLRHAPTRYTLVVRAHHICFDGRSKFVFAREFASFLDLLRCGRTLDLAPVPTYRPEPDLRGLAEAIDFWNGLDVSTMAPLELPGCPADPAGSPIGTIDFDIGVADQQGLRSLSAQAGTNLFGGLLAALATLLHGYGNQQMVLTLPADVSSREGPPSIGLAVNAVPVHLRLIGRPCFLDALAAASQAAQQVRAFRRVPFNRLSTPGARNLFRRVSVSYMRAAVDIPSIPGLLSQWNFLAPNTAETFDLMFHLRDAAGGIPGRLDFRRCHLGTTSAQRLVDDLCKVLSEAVAFPDRPLDDFAAPAPARPLRGKARVPEAPAAPGDDPAQLAGPFRTLHRLPLFPPSLAEVIVPLHEFRPSRRLAEAGISVVTNLEIPGLGVVATHRYAAQEICESTPPKVGEPVPGVELTVTGPTGRRLPAGLPGLLTVEVGQGRWHAGRARLEPGGELTYLGTDEQTVVWAGVSANLAELERLLMLQDGVAEAMASQDTYGIVVRIVPDTDELDLRPLRRLLRRATGIRLSKMEFVHA